MRSKRKPIPKAAMFISRDHSKFSERNGKLKVAKFGLIKWNISHEESSKSLFHLIVERTPKN